MLWRRNRPKWIIDPSNVAFGAVVEHGSRNLSRSHVRVQYRGAPAPQCVPLAVSVRHYREIIRDGVSLDIEHLLVAPILKHRYAKFFDHLADWTRATRRARTSVRARTVVRLTTRPAPCHATRRIRENDRTGSMRMHQACHA
jgi:hypothetical protein